MSETIHTPKLVAGGLVVFFEGMDGTGKTTQLDLAQQVLEADGWSVKTLRGHGGTPIGEALREVSLSKLNRPVLADLYISLAMHAAVAEQVNNYRSDGNIVLIDRGPLSILAYQMYGDGLAPEIVWPAVESDMFQFNPELGIVYTASVATAIERARRKQHGGTDYFESKGPDYFDRVRAGYQAAAQSFDCLTIDTERADIDAVSDQTIQAIKTALLAKDRQA